MINFGVRAPSRDIFEATWKAAGIMNADGSLAPGYAECIQTTAGSWHGIITRQTGTDAEGQPILEPVPGWHCNVRVFGALAVMFTAGCPAEGSIWERTHAAEAFQLTLQPADPETGFPAGMRSATGVVYADVADFTSPSNVWA